MRKNGRIPLIWMLILWQLRNTVQVWKSSKNGFKSVSTWTCVVSPDYLAPTPSTSSAPDPQSPGPSASLVEIQETQKETERALMLLNQQLKEIFN
jgi:hypothetical protein